MSAPTLTPVEFASMYYASSEEDREAYDWLVDIIEGRLDGEGLPRRVVAAPFRRLLKRDPRITERQGDYFWCGGEDPR